MHETYHTMVIFQSEKSLFTIERETHPEIFGEPLRKHLLDLPDVILIVESLPYGRVRHEVGQDAWDDLEGTNE